MSTQVNLVSTTSYLVKNYKFATSFFFFLKLPSSWSHSSIFSNTYGDDEVQQTWSHLGILLNILSTGEVLILGVHYDESVRNGNRERVEPMLGEGDTELAAYGQSI